MRYRIVRSDGYFIVLSKFNWWPFGWSSMGRYFTTIAEAEKAIKLKISIMRTDGDVVREFDKNGKDVALA